MKRGRVCARLAGMSVKPPVAQAFETGIEVFPRQCAKSLQGKRIGLVSHLAAVDRRGVTTAQRLHDTPGLSLSCLMGPEHGFFGTAAAGALCRSQRHPDWRIPVHSLYGDTRKPRPPWLRGLDALVVDLQDLGYRPYTYVSTLRLVLEAAAAAGLPVIVADRPIPLPRTVDGPGLDPRFESFVSAIPAPMVYGMTPGETALWLRDNVVPGATVDVAPMQNYHRDTIPLAGAPPFMRPSPSIVSRESALCFPATVCFEGLTHIDHGRQTAMPFQLIGAPWTRAQPLAEALTDHRLPGVRFHTHLYRPPNAVGSRPFSGIRLTVTDAASFRPVLTGITILHTLTALYGINRVWNRRHTRPDFFDKLLGTDTVRLALLDRVAPADIAAGWRPAHRAFGKQRKPCLLYGSDA